MKVTQKKMPKSQVELDFELTEKEFKHYIDRLGEEKENLLNEAGDIAIKESYIKYIQESNLRPVLNPEILIVKNVQGYPFAFKALITILPDVELPDYKEIAKSVSAQDIFVTEEEIQDSLKYLQKSKAKFILKNAPAEKNDFVEISYQNRGKETNEEIKDKFIIGESGFMPGFGDNLIGMEAGEEKEFKLKLPENSLREDLIGKESEFKVKMISVQNIELPEIDDEFIKQLGLDAKDSKKEGALDLSFDTLVSFKKSMGKGIILKKKEEEKQKRRINILSKIAEKAKLEVPESMIMYEKGKLMDDFKGKITQGMKINFEEYLATTNQTEEQLKEIYQKEAEKRLREFLVLMTIGDVENVEVAPEEVGKMVRELMENSSMGQLDTFNIEELKGYSKGIIFKEKVFQVLESFFE